MKKFNVRKFKFKDTFTFAKIMKNVDVDIKPGDLAGMGVQEIAIATLFKVMSQADLVEQRVYDFIGDIVGLTGDEVANLELQDMMVLFDELAEVNDLADFFIRANTLSKKITQ